MATLHKFKLLATQCAVTATPTQSPTTSPVFHIRRRRKTLRMLLSKNSDVRRRIPRREDESEVEEDPLPEKRSARKKTAGRRVKGMLYERNEDSNEWIDLSNSFCIQGGVGALKML
ncbi:hypothetical protein POTOM_015531 [Populus tomentosa]|uniref:Uncharacterized protein n=1 Tax=Populus tomentosa TaxID=118781 RepID=A0A8X8A214_POPTO|nr:hypothetical protein POTOM_015531 [Populus tomentosa]